MPGGIVTDQGGTDKVRMFSSSLLIQIISTAKIRWVGKIMNAPLPNMLLLIPETYEYVMSHDKRQLAL